MAGSQKKQIALDAPLNVSQYEGTGVARDMFQRNNQLYLGNALSNSLQVRRNGWYFGDKTVDIQPSRNTFNYDDDYSTPTEKQEVVLKNRQNAIQVNHPNPATGAYLIGRGEVKQIWNWSLTRYTRYRDSPIVRLEFQDIFNAPQWIEINLYTLAVTGQSDPAFVHTVSQGNGLIDLMYGIRQGDDNLLKIAIMSAAVSTYSNIDLTIDTIKWTAPNIHEITFANGETLEVTGGTVTGHPSWMRVDTFVNRQLAFTDTYQHQIMISVSTQLKPLRPIVALFDSSLPEDFTVLPLLRGTGWPDGRDGEWRLSVLSPTVTFEGFFNGVVQGARFIPDDPYYSEDAAKHKLSMTYTTSSVQSSVQGAVTQNADGDYTFNLPGPVNQLGMGIGDFASDGTSILWGRKYADITQNITGVDPYWNLNASFQHKYKIVWPGIGYNPVVPGSVHVDLQVSIGSEHMPLIDDETWANAFNMSLQEINGDDGKGAGLWLNKDGINPLINCVFDSWIPRGEAQAFNQRGDHRSYPTWGAVEWVSFPVDVVLDNPNQIFASNPAGVHSYWNVDINVSQGLVETATLINVDTESKFRIEGNTINNPGAALHDQVVRYDHESQAIWFNVGTDRTTGEVISVTPTEYPASDQDWANMFNAAGGPLNIPITAQQQGQFTVNAQRLGEIELQQTTGKLLLIDPLYFDQPSVPDIIPPTPRPALSPTHLGYIGIAPQRLRAHGYPICRVAFCIEAETGRGGVKISYLASADRTLSSTVGLNITLGDGTVVNLTIDVTQTKELLTDAQVALGPASVLISDVLSDATSAGWFQFTYGDTPVTALSAVTFDLTSTDPYVLGVDQAQVDVTTIYPWLAAPLDQAWIIAGTAPPNGAALNMELHNLTTDAAGDAQAVTTLYVYGYTQGALTATGVTTAELGFSAAAEVLNPINTGPISVYEDERGDAVSTLIASWLLLNTTLDIAGEGYLDGTFSLPMPGGTGTLSFDLTTDGNGAIIGVAVPTLFTDDPNGVYNPALPAGQQEAQATFTWKERFRINGIYIVDAEEVDLNTGFIGYTDSTGAMQYIPVTLILASCKGYTVNNWMLKKKRVRYAFKVDMGNFDPMFSATTEGAVVISWKQNILSNPFPMYPVVTLGDRVELGNQLNDGQDSATFKLPDDGQYPVQFGEMYYYPVTPAFIMVQAEDKWQLASINWLLKTSLPHPTSYLAVLQMYIISTNDLTKVGKQATFSIPMQVYTLQASFRNKTISSYDENARTYRITPYHNNKYAATLKLWIDHMYPSVVFASEIMEYAAAGRYPLLIVKRIVVSHSMRADAPLVNLITTLLISTSFGACQVTLNISCYAYYIMTTQNRIDYDTIIKDLRGALSKGVPTYDEVTRSVTLAYDISIRDATNSRSTITLAQTWNTAHLVIPDSALSVTAHSGDFLELSNISWFLSQSDDEEKGQLLFRDDSDKHRMTTPANALISQAGVWTQGTVVSVEETALETLVTVRINGRNWVLSYYNPLWTFEGFAPLYTPGGQQVQHGNELWFYLVSGNYVKILFEYLGLVAPTQHVSWGDILANNAEELRFEIIVNGVRHWVSLNPLYQVFYKILLHEYSNDHKLLESLLEVDVTDEAMVQWKHFPHTNAATGKKEVDLESPYWIDETHVCAITSEYYYIYEMVDAQEQYPDNFQNCLGVWEQKNRIQLRDGDPRPNKQLIKDFISNADRTSSPVHLKIYQQGTQLEVYTQPASNLLNPLTYNTYNKVTVAFSMTALTGREINVWPNEGTITQITDINFINDYTRRFLNATMLEGQLLLGIRLQDPVLQYVLVFNDITSIQSIIKGYSYIGLNGWITGGIYPSKFLNEKGLYKAPSVQSPELWSGVLTGSDYYLITDGRYFFLTSSDVLTHYAVFKNGVIGYVNTDRHISVVFNKYAEASGNYSISFGTTIVNVADYVKQKTNAWGRATSIHIAINSVFDTINDLIDAGVVAIDAGLEAASGGSIAGLVATAAAAIIAAAARTALIAAVNLAVQEILVGIAALIVDIMTDFDWNFELVTVKIQHRAIANAGMVVVANCWRSEATATALSLSKETTEAEWSINIDDMRSNCEAAALLHLLTPFVTDMLSYPTACLGSSKWSTNKTDPVTLAAHQTLYGASAYSTLDIPLHLFYSIGLNSAVWAGPGWIEDNMYFVAPSVTSVDSNITVTNREECADTSSFWPDNLFTFDMYYPRLKYGVNGISSENASGGTGGGGGSTGADPGAGTTLGGQ